jgi:hypothetical protein
MALRKRAAQSDFSPIVRVLLLARECCFTFVDLQKETDKTGKTSLSRNIVDFKGRVEHIMYMLHLFEFERSIRSEVRENASACEITDLDQDVALKIHVSIV